MSEQRGADEGRPEGSHGPAAAKSGEVRRSQFNSVSATSRDFPPWAMDVAKVIGGGVFGAVLAWSTMKDGIATGKRGFELGLEARAAVADAKTKAEANLAAATLAWTRANKNLSISLGRIMDKHVERIVAAQAKTDRAVAVLTEAQQRAENASRERDERIEVELRDWQIRTRVKP